MPNYDFRCKAGHVFERISSPMPLGGIEPVLCPCGYMADQVWLKAPGVQADEAPPADLLAAARSGKIFSKVATDPVEPFTGSTRRELRKWEEKHNCSPMSSDEISRIPERKFKPSEDAATRKMSEELNLKAFELADAGKLKDEVRMKVAPVNKEEADLVKAQHPTVAGSSVADAVAAEAVPVSATVETEEIVIHG
jgi:hypothetical protein